MRRHSVAVAAILCIVTIIGLWLLAEGDGTAPHQGRISAPRQDVTQALATPEAPGDMARDRSAIAGSPEAHIQGVAVSVPTGPQVRFGGHVVTTQGSVLQGVQVFVFDRAPLPGEPGNRVEPMQATTDLRGAFSVALPRTWSGATVFVAVWHADRQLGMGSYPVSSSATVLVPDPNSPPGIWVNVHWVTHRPKSAAIMLQSHDRTNQLAEAIWECEQSKVFLPFRLPESEVDSPVSLFIGELPDPGNPRLAILKVVRLSGLREIEAVAMSGVTVDCTEQRVQVPAWDGVVPSKVGLWTKFDAREARLLMVDNGQVGQLLSKELDYSAVGQCADGTTTFGYLKKGSANTIVWVQEVDPTVHVEATVLDVRGSPLSGAIARFILANDDPQIDKLHRKAARSDDAGHIVATGFCKGDYTLAVETMELGDWRHATKRVSVRGNIGQVVLPDAFVGRLVPVGLPAGMSNTDMRGWVKPPNGAWRECTDREWKHLGSGIVGFSGLGTHELIVRVPPFVGITSHDVARPNEIVDVNVVMALETQVSGRIATSEGKALAGRWVSVLQESSGSRPGGPSWSMAQTGEDGGYSLSLIPGRSGELRVWDRECRRVAATVPAAIGNFTVDAGK